jgi:hypothetical protein
MYVLMPNIRGIFTEFFPRRVTANFGLRDMLAQPCLCRERALVTVPTVYRRHRALEV